MRFDINAKSFEDYEVVQRRRSGRGVGPCYQKLSFDLIDSLHDTRSFTYEPSKIPSFP